MVSPILLFACGFGGILRRRSFGRRMMSSSNSSSSSPWLMLPPTRDKRRGGMVYNFYSLGDDEVVVLNKYGGGDSPDDDARVVGSSHGWLALMNRRNNDLFLSNPLSRRHIKLPPIDALPDPEINLHFRGSVSKLILSASPDDGECRAMMSFGPCDRLAICRPGRSKEWTPMGDLFLDPVPTTNFKLARAYGDFVYSRGRSLFSCLALTDDYDFVLEEWDPHPRIHWTQKEPLPAVEENRGFMHKIPAIQMCRSTYKYWLDDDKAELFRRCERIPKHLAYVEATDELLLLFRYAHEGTTVGFIAARVEKEKEKEIRLIATTLEGLAVFVGTNHSFAVSPSAEDFPHLKPNSIYFTDNKELYTPRADYLRNNFQGGDVGIFDCVHGTFSSCYYPFHQTTLSKSIVPAPIWFTPTLPKP